MYAHVIRVSECWDKGLQMIAEHHTLLQLCLYMSYVGAHDMSHIPIGKRIRLRVVVFIHPIVGYFLNSFGLNKFSDFGNFSLRIK